MMHRELLEGMRLRVALPKGRLFDSTIELLSKADINIVVEGRKYKPESDCAGLELFIIKPRNIPKMVEEGLLDAGFVGNDLVEDEEAQVDALLDSGLMPVHLIVAGRQEPPQGKAVRVATEYTNIARAYFAKRGVPFEILKTYGSTECFVPEFADVIVDHAQTGASLRENGLRVLDIVMSSSTKLIANRSLDRRRREELEALARRLEEAAGRIDRSYPGFLSAQELRENRFENRTEISTGIRTGNRTEKSTWDRALEVV